MNYRPNQSLVDVQHIKKVLKEIFPGEPVSAERVAEGSRPTSTALPSHAKPFICVFCHGDFDTAQIYQDNGHYTGIIDFGEIRGASRWYDLGHFHMRDGELLPFHLLPALVCGYKEVASLPLAYEQHFIPKWTGIGIKRMSSYKSSVPTFLHVEGC